MNDLLLWLLMMMQPMPDLAMKQISDSGRVVEAAASPSTRVDEHPRLLAPGPPPLLSFRLLDGKARHRFGDLDLVLDDAGH